MREKIREKMANFCKDRCPIAKRANQRPEGTIYWLVKNVGRRVCLMGRAYKRQYGKEAER